MQIVEVPIKDIRLADYNPREITDKAFQDLRNSIKKFGIRENAVLNKNNTCIGGHMRIRAAQVEGYTTYPCEYVDLTDNEAKILNLALNKITGRWSHDKLTELITSLKEGDLDLSLTGFEDWELEYYNAGPKDAELSDLDDNAQGLQGTEPNKSFTLIFTFKDEKRYMDAAVFLGEGKFKRVFDGEVLEDFINGGLKQ